MTFKYFLFSIFKKWFLLKGLYMCALADQRRHHPVTNVRRMFFHNVLKWKFTCGRFLSYSAESEVGSKRSRIIGEYVENYRWAHWAKTRLVFTTEVLFWKHDMRSWVNMCISSSLCHYFLTATVQRRLNAVYFNIQGICVFCNVKVLLNP